MDKRAADKAIKEHCRKECYDSFCYFDGSYLLVAYFSVVMLVGNCDYGNKETTAAISLAVVLVLGIIFHFAVKKHRCRHCR